MSAESEQLLAWPGDFDSRLLQTIEKLQSVDQQLADRVEWPTELWSILQSIDANCWSAREAIGLAVADRRVTLQRYAMLASGSLSAAFILTQHDAAIRRLAVDVDGNHDILDQVIKASLFPTVGISQLTTSRRFGAQAMTAVEVPGGFRLNGRMPWVTAADRADLIVTGAFLEDGRQFLGYVKRGHPGLIVEPPYDLAALRCSRTCEVRCEDMLLEHVDILAGPSMSVVSIPGLAGTGGLETSAVALGLSFSAIKALQNLSLERPTLQESTLALVSNWHEAWTNLNTTAMNASGCLPNETIRLNSNSLALRSTQAYLTMSKGSGFVTDHPAQRWAREALFFLVWSCPTSVAQAAVESFAGVCPI